MPLFFSTSPKLDNDGVTQPEQTVTSAHAPNSCFCVSFPFFRHLLSIPHLLHFVVSAPPCFLTILLCVFPVGFSSPLLYLPPVRPSSTILPTLQLRMFWSKSVFWASAALLLFHLYFLFDGESWGVLHRLWWGDWRLCLSSQIWLFNSSPGTLSWACTGPNSPRETSDGRDDGVALGRRSGW